MLKHVYLNNKKLPVPVPIHTLAEAIRWAEEALLSADRIITKVVLDGAAHDEVLEHGEISDLPLSSNSKLQLQVDSARDLSLQTIDVLRNLVSVLERHLKPMAVTLWQGSGNIAPQGLTPLLGDIGLMQGLLWHLLGIIDRQPDQRLEPIAQRLDGLMIELQRLAGLFDWRAMAKLLLNQYEPEIMALTAELASQQRLLFDLDQR